jgi:hypothetical protein
LTPPRGGPAPSGSTGTSRRCQGCSRPPRRLPAQASLSFTGSLRRPGSGVLSPPHGHEAPRGARFPCSARMRPGWLRLPSLPRAPVPTASGDLPAARLPHRNGRPLASRTTTRDVSVTRHQQGFTVIHPTPAFPSPVTPGGTGSSGFPWEHAGSGCSGDTGRHGEPILQARRP